MLASIDPRALAAAATAKPVPFLPGVATASEIMNALDHGFTYLKFFPATAAGGPPTLQALLNRDTFVAEATTIESSGLGFRAVDDLPTGVDALRIEQLPARRRGQHRVQVHDPAVLPQDRAALR